MQSSSAQYQHSGELAQTVKKLSSSLFIPQEQRIMVPANHANMVKFGDPSDATYMTVARLLRKSISTIREEGN